MQFLWQPLVFSLLTFHFWGLNFHSNTVPSYVDTHLETSPEMCICSLNWHLGNVRLLDPVQIRCIKIIFIAWRHISRGPQSIEVKSSKKENLWVLIWHHPMIFSSTRKSRSTGPEVPIKNLCCMHIKFGIFWRKYKEALTTIFLNLWTH